MASITPLSFQPWKLVVNAGLDYFISTSQSSHPLKSEWQLQYLSYQIILAASTQTRIKILVSLTLIWLSLYRSKNWNKLLCDENSSNEDEKKDESQREHLPMFVSIFNQVFNIHDWVDQFFLCTLFCEKL